MRPGRECGIITQHFDPASLVSGGKKAFWRVESDGLVSEIRTVPSTFVVYGKRGSSSNGTLKKGGIAIIRPLVNLCIFLG